MLLKSMVHALKTKELELLPTLT